MKTSLLTTRRVLIATLAIALVGTLAFVSLRTGPLAPIKVTVAQPTEGSMSPSIFGIGTV